HVWRGEWEASVTYATEVTRLAARGSEPWIKGQLALLGAAFYLGRPLQVLDKLALLMGVDPPPGVTHWLIRSLSLGVTVACWLARFDLRNDGALADAALIAIRAARNQIGASLRPNEVVLQIEVPDEAALHPFERAPRGRNVGDLGDYVRCVTVRPAG